MRVVVALALGGLIFATLFTSRAAWFVVVASAVLLAQYELYRALGARGARPATLWGMATGATLFAGAYLGGTTAIAFALTMGIIGTMLWFVVEPARAGVTANIGATLLGIVYVPLLGAHVWLMRDLPHGPAITIGYIGLVAFYDIGAFFSGRTFGRHPMAPHVSPKKTWEGAAGATVFIFVLALVVGPFIGPFTLASSAALAALVAVVAPLGDLAESMLKRDLDLKDIGTVLPGHGGMLDRIDALLLVAPGFYWAARALTA